jgi:hypothetical protein
MIDGTYRQTNLPNESAEYLAKREEVRLAEIELMKQREKVAALRRQLPPGASVEDYEFIMSIWQLWLRLICLHCARTRGTEVGTGCVC